jgi:dipeptidyl aminopeptidase/acylaminoacyl peptidase
MVEMHDQVVFFYDFCPKPKMIIMNRILLYLLFISCPFAVINAQKTLTPELLWSLDRLGEHQLSPDGKTVLYHVRKFDPVANKGYGFIYTIPASGGKSVLVADTSNKASNAKWSHDGKKIFFQSSLSGNSQLWEMMPDGSDKKQVSQHPGGITDYGFNANGTKVWLTSEVKVGKSTSDIYPDLPLATGRIYDDLMYRHWDHWADENYSHIFVAGYANGAITGNPADIMRGEPFDSPLMPFGGSSQIAWSPDGTQLAYTCKKLSGRGYAMSTNSDIYLYDVSSGKTTNLTDGMKGYDTNPLFSPDGKRITWLSMETQMYEADRNRIFEYTFQTKSKVELTTGFDYTVESYKFSPDGQSILFQSGINATDQLWVYDYKSSPSSRIRQITKDMADVTGFSVATDGKNTVVVTSVMSISSPSDLFRLDLKTGTSTRITELNREKLAGISMGKVEKRMVKATDGKEILTWVIYPPGFDPSKKYPALLYCQGGPQSTVSQFFSYRWNFQLMAANNYIVVAPNRRGLPSFGTEWNRQISGDWGGQAMKDLLSAIDDVSNEPYVDKNKLGAVGASFGGYSVYWLAGNHNKRFKALISHCGVFNLESMYGTTEELFFADFDMGGPYFAQPKPKTYLQFNPIDFVMEWDTPILIFHNDLDFRVPISQGMEAFTAARLRNIPARFVSFPDENHWVLKPQNGIMWQREFFGWLGKYLK